MRIVPWVAWSLAGLFTSGTLMSCGQSEAPATQPTPPEQARYGTPRPIQPLTGATQPSYSYAPSVNPQPAYNLGDNRVLNVSLSGDPARIVYPGQNLTPGSLYPVMIFLHGYGMDQTQMTDRTGLADAAAHEGWISASCFCGSRSHWANDQALRDVGNLIAELVAHHQADPKRIYMVGFSMGGGTALLAAENVLNLPYRVAAVVSTQGFTDLEAMTDQDANGGAYARSIYDAYGGDLSPDTAAAHSPQDHAEALQGIPVYLEHGQADANVPDIHSIQMADKLKALGMTPELHLYPGLTHGESTIHEDAIINFLRGKAAP